MKSGALGTVQSGLGYLELGFYSEESGAVSGSFTADAVLLKTVSVTFTADANIAGNEVAATFTADAYLVSTVSGSFTANAVLFVTDLNTFTANASIRAKIVEDTFTRSLTDEIGTPDLGHAALIHQGIDNEFTIDGSKFVSVSGDKDSWVQYGPSTHVGDIYIDFVASDNIYLFIAGPSYFNTGNSRWYIPYLEFFDDRTGFTNWTLQNDTSSVLLGSTVEGSTYRMRLHYDNFNAVQKGKVWLASGSEPSTWNLETVIQPSLTTSVLGDVLHAQFYVGPWNNVATATKTVDNFVVWTSNTSLTNDFFTADAYMISVVSGSFTADAVITEETGTFERTFTADAYLVVSIVEVTFTADARILRNSGTQTFTANARLVATDANTFTADAWFRVEEPKTFSAAAYLIRPPATGRFTQRRKPTGLAKTVTMHILQHREKPLPTFVPPRTGDDEVPEDGLGGPPCLPPCPGAGAGYGSLYGANGGAIVHTITHCTSPSCSERYYNEADNWLGRGNPVSLNTHCDCGVSHSYGDHVNRMWITYNSMPTTPFRMRGKMIWLEGSPSNVAVNVYANATAPTLEIDDCSATASYWDSGQLIGTLSFSADGSGTLATRDVWFQELPSSLTIDPGAIAGNTFRFALQDEDTYYRAEFKAANVEIVID